MQFFRCIPVFLIVLGYFLEVFGNTHKQKTCPLFYAQWNPLSHWIFGLNLKSIGVMVLELYYFVLLRNIRSEDLVGAWGKKKQKIIFWAFGSWNNNKNWNFSQDCTVVEWKWKYRILTWNQAFRTAILLFL